jgi:hypothetical protein
MKGDIIPDDNHIARLCSRKHVKDEQIQPTAFHLRKDEDYLSVNWLEFLNYSCREEEMDEIRNIYKAKLEIKPRDRIAILNVGTVRSEVLIKSEDSRNLEVLHEPLLGHEINDPSHSEIHNLRQDDIMIAELILETILESYSAC